MRSYLPSLQIIGERNCGSYNRCTTSTRVLQLTMMMMLDNRSANQEQPSCDEQFGFTSCVFSLVNSKIVLVSKGKGSEVIRGKQTNLAVHKILSFIAYRAS
ncbi:hypothetical protein T265_02326 [Opisthorchis viverrini]|uniref:Uncharacterized protein n=1 Tax=Opisthorchis viverrini TaxID=6198 RepID=A0A074ZVB9_OPIVI|nr:hypothetical protein T265_02326 [Opisthorchis viverrini]KER31413.1 hypothetical protein T265_02326 [Opisthorchis viverrini]